MDGAYISNNLEIGAQRLQRSLAREGAQDPSGVWTAEGHANELRLDPMSDEESAQISSS